MSLAYLDIMVKGGATKLKMGSEGQCIGGGGNTVKTQTIEKIWECMTPPPSFYGGAAPDHSAEHFTLFALHKYSWS